MAAPERRKPRSPQYQNGSRTTPPKGFTYTHQSPIIPTELPIPLPASPRGSSQQNRRGHTTETRPAVLFYPNPTINQPNTDHIHVYSRQESTSTGVIHDDQPRNRKKYSLPSYHRIIRTQDRVRNRRDPPPCPPYPRIPRTRTGTAGRRHLCTLSRRGDYITRTLWTYLTRLLYPSG